MKVRAKSTGYYDLKRRKEGAVFELATVSGITIDKHGKKSPVTFTPEQQFSEKWMERVDVDVEAEPKIEQPRKPVAMSKLNRKAVLSADDQI